MQTIGGVYSIASRRLRALAALERMQLDDGVTRDRVVSPQYEGETRWLSLLIVMRSHLRLRQYYDRLKRLRASATDPHTLLPSTLDILTDSEAEDCVDFIDVNLSLSLVCLFVYIRY